MRTVVQNFLLKAKFLYGKIKMGQVVIQSFINFFYTQVHHKLAIRSKEIN